MASKQYLLYERLRGLGLFLLGLASILASACLLFLVRQNDTLDDRLECRARIRDDLDVAIARGLVAVAYGDDAALQVQVDRIVEVANRVGEC